MNGQTKKLFEKTDWNSLTKVRILEMSSDDNILTILEIRGEPYKLLFYDWYMLIALEMTDSFDGIDSDYVITLRISIREDYQKFNSHFIDILYQYKYYSLASLDMYIEIFNGYSEMLLIQYKDEEFERWFEKQENELKIILEKIPENMAKKK